MSNYTKSTNFATKDNLTPGDPLKVVRGTEIDTEYNNIATAIATKTDNASAAITGGTITGITDLAVADGGTGASTAAGALNNLLPSQTSNANKYLQTDGTNATWDAVTLSTADITGTLAVANGGTGVTTSTGTTNVVLSNSPTLVTPALGTPSSATLTNATGLPISTGVSGLGTGVATFLGTPSSANLLAAVSDETGSGSLVFATSPTLVTPILGTPTSGTLTNATGLPIGTGVSGLGTGVATFLATPSSANLLAAVTDETGTGSLVFATSPTLVTPALGTPASGVVTNLTGTASININGTVGATTASTGAFTTTTVSTSETLSYGTANGVTYLNGSKVLTSGSALVFDGTNLGVSVTPSTWSTGSALEINAKGNAIWGVGSSNINVLSNAYYNGGFLYASTGAASNYQQASGAHKWLTVASGTINTAITFTQAMTLDASGNLGVGTTSPSARLHISGTTDATQRIIVNGSGNYSSLKLQYNGTEVAQFQNYQNSEVSIGSTASAPLYLVTNNTTKATITSAGNFGIGTTSPRTTLDVNGNAYIAGGGQLQITGSAGSTGLQLIGQDAAESTIGTMGSQALVFRTGSTERARIHSGGQFTVGTTDAGQTSGNGVKFLPTGGGTSIPTINIVGNSSDSGQGSYHLYSSSLSQYQFYVTYSGNIYARSTSITSISDQTEKTNVRDLETGLNSVLALKPRRFDWLNGQGSDIAGFIAQEVQTVLPDLVVPYKLSDTETKLGLRMGDMIPTLVKAIQELKAEFDAYKASHP